MKQVLLIALALSCAYATQVDAFNFQVGDWIMTLINRFILQIVLSFYSIFGLLFALFGSPLWFSQMSWAAVSGSFALPAYSQFSSLSS